MRHLRLLDPDPPFGPGIFGLNHSPDEALVHLVPIPFEATVSYQSGAARGPEAIYAASAQVDLLDPDFGRIHRAGIYAHPHPRAVEHLSQETRAAAEKVIAVMGEIGEDKELAEALDRVNEAGRRLNASLETKVSRLLLADKIVGVLGGDHSVPFGAIKAVSRARPGMGILHIDAHADLRAAYQGFEWSHASIMHNVMSRLPDVHKLVQVGIRDFCEEEARFIRNSKGRIRTAFDRDLRAARLKQGSILDLFDRFLEELPAEVWVSFDIDGLDPALCPHTGTPVPGGLSFDEATALLRGLVQSGRKILGFDLVEVAPGPGPIGDSFDANVGARVLYKLIGATLRSRMVSLSSL